MQDMSCNGNRSGWQWICEFEFPPLPARAPLTRDFLAMDESRDIPERQLIS